MEGVAGKPFILLFCFISLQTIWHCAQTRCSLQCELEACCFGGNHSTPSLISIDQGRAVGVQWSVIPITANRALPAPFCLSSVGSGGSTVAPCVFYGATALVLC